MYGIKKNIFFSYAIDDWIYRERKKTKKRKNQKQYQLANILIGLSSLHESSFHSSFIGYHLHNVSLCRCPLITITLLYKSFRHIQLNQNQQLQTSLEMFIDSAHSFLVRIFHVSSASCCYFICWMPFKWMCK